MSAHPDSVEYSPERFKCPANGCIYAGSISNATNGTGQWYCRFHFNEPAAIWDAITLALRTQQAQRKLADYMQHQANDDEIDDRIGNLSVMDVNSLGECSTPLEKRRELAKMLRRRADDHVYLATSEARKKNDALMNPREKPLF